MPRAPGNESLSEGWIIQPASSGQLARRRVTAFGNERVQPMGREKDGECQGKPAARSRRIGNSRRIVWMLPTLSNTPHRLGSASWQERQVKYRAPRERAVT